jgi:hypothetical protein
MRQLGIYFSIVFLSGCEPKIVDQCPPPESPELVSYGREQLLKHLKYLFSEDIDISDRGLVLKSSIFDEIVSNDLVFVDRFPAEGGTHTVLEFGIDRIPAFEFYTWITPKCHVEFGYSRVSK